MTLWLVAVECEAETYEQASENVHELIEFANENSFGNTPASLPDYEAQVRRG